MSLYFFFISLCMLSPQAAIPLLCSTASKYVEASLSLLLILLYTVSISSILDASIPASFIFLNASGSFCFKRAIALSMTTCLFFEKFSLFLGSRIYAISLTSALRISFIVNEVLLSSSSPILLMSSFSLKSLSFDSLKVCI